MFQSLLLSSVSAGGSTQPGAAGPSSGVVVDVTEAETLPPECYTNEEFFAFVRRARSDGQLVLLAGVPAGHQLQAVAEPECQNRGKRHSRQRLARREVWLDRRRKPATARDGVAHLLLQVVGLGVRRLQQGHRVWPVGRGPEVDHPFVFCVQLPDGADLDGQGLRAHDEGAELLKECLQGKVEMDFDTARRLFTLICVLHIKQSTTAVDSHAPGPASSGA